MALAHRVGFHNGKLTAKDILVTDTLEIQGNMTFGNASTDTLTVTGTLNATSSIQLGTFSSPVTCQNTDYTASGSAYSITKSMISGLVSETIDTGYVIRQLWSRLKITTDQDSGKGASFYGACLQARIHTGSAAVAIDDGVYAGTWNYLENSDSDANLTIGGGNFYGSRNMIELISSATVNGGTFAGGEFINHVDCSMASATKFDAILINKVSGAQDWTIGVDISDSTTAINIGSCTGGLVFTGTTSYILDFDNVTTGAATVTSSAATTIKAQMLVKTPAGDTGYINIYGTTGN